MRKHNEGYALVLVLVVLIVLALLATVILGSAQRNLDAQKNSIEYMKCKYQAQGEIEKIVTTLEIQDEGTIGYKDEDSTAVVTPLEDSVEIASVCECEDVQITCVYTHVADPEVGHTFVCSEYQISTIGGNDE